MTLFVVATPIGNLGDMTFRAVETLKSVSLVAAEDTRTARKLFARYEIQTPLTSFHAHSSERELMKIVARLREGEEVALISDAGTPGISDPGYRLITAVLRPLRQACLPAGKAQGRLPEVKIVPIPGPSAVVTALSAAGLPTDKFLYLGFLPVKKGRQTLIQSLQDEKRTVVFYESVHRIGKTLNQFAEILGGDRRVVVARELTKMYEEFFRGTLAGATAWTAGQKPRGEFVVVLGGVNLKQD